MADDHNCENVLEEWSKISGYDTLDFSCDTLIGIILGVAILLPVVGVIFLMVIASREARRNRHYTNIDDETRMFRALMIQQRRARRAQHLVDVCDGETRPLLTTPTRTPIPSDRQALIHRHLFHWKLEHDGDDEITLQSMSSNIASSQHRPLEDGYSVSARVLRPTKYGLGSGRSLSTECSICLDRYAVGDTVCWARTDQCKHMFHQDCIAQWLQDHCNCPLCRVDIITVHFDSDHLPAAIL